MAEQLAQQYVDGGGGLADLTLEAPAKVEEPVSEPELAAVSADATSADDAQTDA